MIENITEDKLNFYTYLVKGTAASKELSERVQNCWERMQTVRRNVSRHSPKKMIEFLSLFSKDDNFKWYTHKWDQSGLTLDNLMENQLSRKSELSSRAYKSAEPINEKTFTQVWNFINFTPKELYPWVDNEGNNQLTGWHSIIELHKQNPDLPIENLQLPDGYIFKDFIRLFKSSIEFRTDLRPEDRFRSLVRKTIKIAVNGAVDIIYTPEFKKIGYDINIYCDIPALIFGLRIICDWIVKHKVNGSHVTVDLVAKEDCYELSIFHEGSYFSNKHKLESPSGDFAKLRYRLFSVCDLTLIGDYVKDGANEGSLQVYALEPGTKKIDNKLSQCRIESSDLSVGGVKYVIKLYK